MTTEEDCFHLGAKAFILSSSGSLLLLKQNPNKSINTRDGRWDIPGGRIQRNETLESALRREVLEETGIDNLIHLKPFLTVLTNLRIRLSSSDVGLILSTYLASVPYNTPVKLSDEHIQFQWTTPKEASGLLNHYPEPLLERLFNL